jgi:signal transduction histidine kinase
LLHAGHQLTITLVAAGTPIFAGLIGAAVLLRLIVTAALARLRQEVQRVTRGGHDTPLPFVGGAREIVEVQADVEAMREIIVGELAAVQSARAQLEAQASELERSNRDLEQFAYVASHDCRSRCARSPASARRSRRATTASSTNERTATLSSPSTARSGCRS